MPILFCDNDPPVCEELPPLVVEKTSLRHYIENVCGGKDLINFANFTPGEVVESFKAAREWSIKFRAAVRPLGSDAPQIICEGARVYIYYKKE